LRCTVSSGQLNCSGLVSHRGWIGFSGILVPMVDTAEQVREVIAASRFPPMGVRGQGSPFCGSAFGISTEDYVKQANHTVLVIVQIESRLGLGNIAEICQVDDLGKQSDLIDTS
jgi:2-keto-3-deoxy-L-rhamnonate aldolase RhmA